MMEKVVNARLMWYLTLAHYCFRKIRPTTDALLCLEYSICEALAKDKHHVIFFFLRKNLRHCIVPWDLMSLSLSFVVSSLILLNSFHLTDFYMYQLEALCLNHAQLKMCHNGVY